MKPPFAVLYFSCMLTILCITSCVAPRQYEHNRDTTFPVNDENQSPFYLQYNEYGALYDASELKDALGCISKLKSNGIPVNLLLFVHGWGGDARTGGYSVINFTNMLNAVHSAYEQDMLGRKSHTVGVFVGWRGKSAIQPFHYFTFLGREQAAKEISGPDLTASLWQLISEAQGSVRVEYIVKGQLPPPGRVVAVGHSLGALVLMGTMDQALVGMASQEKHIKELKDLSLIEANKQLHGINEQYKLVEELQNMNASRQESINKYEADLNIVRSKISGHISNSWDQVSVIESNLSILAKYFEELSGSLKTNGPAFHFLSSDIGLFDEKFLKRIWKIISFSGVTKNKAIDSLSRHAELQSIFETQSQSYLITAAQIREAVNASLGTENSCPVITKVNYSMLDDEVVNHTKDLLVGYQILMADSECRVALQRQMTNNYTEDALSAQKAYIRWLAGLTECSTNQVLLDCIKAKINEEEKFIEGKLIPLVKKMSDIINEKLKLVQRKVELAQQKIDRQCEDVEKLSEDAKIIKERVDKLKHEMLSAQTMSRTEEDKVWSRSNELAEYIFVSWLVRNRMDAKRPDSLILAAPAFSEFYLDSVERAINISLVNEAIRRPWIVTVASPNDSALTKYFPRSMKFKYLFDVNGGHKHEPQLGSRYYPGALSAKRTIRADPIKQLPADSPVPRKGRVLLSETGTIWSNVLATSSVVRLETRHIMRGHNDVFSPEFISLATNIIHNTSRNNGSDFLGTNEQVAIYVLTNELTATWFIDQAVSNSLSPTVIWCHLMSNKLNHIGIEIPQNTISWLHGDSTSCLVRVISADTTNDYTILRGDKALHHELVEALSNKTILARKVWLKMDKQE